MKKTLRAAVEKALINVSKKSDIERIAHDIGGVQSRLDLLEGLYKDTARSAHAQKEDIQSLLTSLQQPLAEDQQRAFLGRDVKKPSFLLFGTHDYGNIGDLAINHSEATFLRTHFPDYPLFIFSRQTLLANWQLIINSVTGHDIVFIHGGGNLGDIWLNEERARREIIKSLPDNKIISLPQSIKFYDKNELAISQKVYSAHKNLLLLVRDDASMDFAKSNFVGVNSCRTEDIVLSYRFAAPERADNDNVVFLERSDREKGSDNLEEVRSMVRKLKLPNYTSDTVIEGLHMPTRGIEARLVYDKIDEVHAARLIVTNRLHGAIFALLAGRPVIVVENSYGKIEGALTNIAGKVGRQVTFANEDGSNITPELIKTLYQLEDAKKVPSELQADTFKELHARIHEFIRT